MDSRKPLLSKKDRTSEGVLLEAGVKRVVHYPNAIVVHSPWQRKRFLGVVNACVLKTI